MATPPHVPTCFFSSSRPQTPHGQCNRSCLRHRSLLQPHIESHSCFFLPLFQNEAECHVQLIVKVWNLENVFPRVWEFMRWLHFGIWVLHHRILLHAVICVNVCKVCVLGQGHSTAYLFALVRSQVAQAQNMSIGKHRRASSLLRNIQNIRIRMGKKPIVSLTYENERISIKTAYLT